MFVARRSCTYIWGLKSCSLLAVDADADADA